MDQYIAQICKEAEEKLRALTNVTEQELTECRAENTKLSQHAQALEDRIKLLEAGLQQQQQQQHEPGLSQHGLAAKYEKLKENYEMIQGRYRKERNIWKKWIDHFQREEERTKLSIPTPKDNRLVVQENCGMQAMPLLDLSPNIAPSPSPSSAPSRIADSNAQEQHAIHVSRTNADVTDSQHASFENKASAPLDHFIPPSSSQDAGSIDLDQVTVRKAQPTFKRSYTVEATRHERCQDDNINNRAAQSAFSTASRSRRRGSFERAVAEDEHSQPVVPIKHEMCSSPRSSPLGHLLSHNNSVLPGQRQVEIKIAESDNDFSHPSIHRGIKRNRSEGTNTDLETTSVTSEVVQKPDQHRPAQYAARTASRQSRSMIDYSAHSRAQHVTPKHDGIRVVRGAARKALHAVDCKCCSNFYRLTGPPLQSTEPAWRSPPRDVQPRGDYSSKQQVGRHRSVWRRSPTPPEFWDPDFPTTQQITKEKQDNKRRRSRKLSGVDGK